MASVYVQGLLKESDSRQKGKGEGLLSRRYKLSQASSACPIRSSIFNGLDQSCGRLRRIPEDPCVSFVRSIVSMKPWWSTFLGASSVFQELKRIPPTTAPLCHSMSSAPFPSKSWWKAVTLQGGVTTFPALSHTEGIAAGLPCHAFEVYLLSILCFAVLAMQRTYIWAVPKVPKQCAWKASPLCPQIASCTPT